MATAATHLITAYRQTDAGGRVVPADSDQTAPLVTLLVLERAFEDVALTATSTPEWLESAIAALDAVIR